MTNTAFETKDNAYIETIPYEKKQIKKIIKKAIKKGKQEAVIHLYNEWLPEKSILKELLDKKYDLYFARNMAIEDKRKRYKIYVAFNKAANGKVYFIDPTKWEIKEETTLDKIYE